MAHAQLSRGVTPRIFEIRLKADVVVYIIFNFLFLFLIRIVDFGKADTSVKISIFFPGPFRPGQLAVPASS